MGNLTEDRPARLKKKVLSLSRQPVQCFYNVMIALCGKTRRCFLVDYSLLSALSIVFLWKFTQFRERPFQIDDNFSQWEPVIDYAFSELLSGHFPYWTPYQWGGFRIDTVGYYGIFNPLMLIAYLLHLVVPTDTITLYAHISLCCGICLAYTLGNAVGLPRSTRFSLALAYGCSPGYFLIGVWYYLFNAFVLIPAIFLFLAKSLSSHSKKFMFRCSFIEGLLLAFGLYLGNAQYAIYTAVIYGLTQSLLFVLSREKKLRMKLWLTSMTTFAVASFPVVCLYKRAANDLLFAGDPTGAPSNLIDNLRCIFLPFDLAKALYKYAPVKVVFLPHGNAGNGALSLIATLGIIFLLFRKRFEPLQHLCFSLSFSIAIVLYISGGPAILRYAPVVNRFRYASKWLFMLSPTILVLSVVCLAGASRAFQRTSTAISLMGILLALCYTNGTDLNYTPPPGAVQCSSVKTQTAPNSRTIFADRRPFHNTFRLDSCRLLGNSATAQRIPGLIGYNLSCPQAYRPDMLALIGADWELGKYLDLKKLENVDPVYLELLAEYAVRKVYVPSYFRPASTDFYQVVKDKNDSGGPSIYLANSPALVSNAGNEEKEFVLHADEIEVRHVRSEDREIIARWWNLDGFSAYLVGPNQTHRPLALIGKKFLQVRIPKDFQGTVIFHIFDWRAWASLFFAWAILIIFVVHLPRTSRASNH